MLGLCHQGGGWVGGRVFRKLWGGWVLEDHPPVGVGHFEGFQPAPKAPQERICRIGLEISPPPPGLCGVVNLKGQRSAEGDNQHCL